MTFRALFLACVFCTVARAAETGMGGSILGFIFDPANGVQPIIGLSGAATIGPPLELGANLTGIVTFAQQNYALANTDADSNFVRIKLTEPASILPLGLPVAASRLVAVSPRGSTAAFYDRDRNRILVVRGLPEAAAVASEFDLTGFPEPTSLAVNDGADMALIGFSDADLAMGVDGRVLSLGRRATAVRFLAESRDAVIADGGTNTVYLAKNLAGSPEFTPLIDGIAEPAAVAVSNDNKKVFVASSLARTVTGIELATGAITVTSCPCRPSTLADLNGNAVFRLTEPSGNPLWVFDGDGPEARIVFVPAYRPVRESDAQ